jgi:glycine/D-amino acid oxidase-like deaminating enzyme/nitrite reductase/ring-hydroxylating ferredoxin subunit
MSSVWEVARLSDLGYPPLQGRVEVDVAIIGGGITGLMTAARLHDEGKRVAVLEAHLIGAGNTGGSTGNLYATVSQGLATVRKKWNDDVLREVVALRSQAVALLEETSKRFGIDCDFARRPLYFCVRGDDKQAKMLDAEHAASIAAGLDASLLEAVAELPFSVRRALRIEQQAQFNPLRFVQGLAKALGERGVQIFEHSYATDVDAGEGVVKTERGELVAKHIVYATHTPKGINMVQAEMVPYREHGVAVRLNGSQYPDGIFWVLDDSRSVRSYHHDGDHYLVIIGEKHKTGHGSLGEGYYQKLHQYAHDHFDVAAFAHKWSAQQYQSADSLPYIGRSGHGNVYIGTGYAADGLTWGAAAAMIISDLILDRDNRWSDLLTPRRFTPAKSAKTWLEENAMVAQHLVKDYLTPAQLKNLKDVPPDSGRIVELDGEKLAVYRAQDGSVTVHSAVCPHMKCMVDWNGADRTWDCPCHGSRFATDGSVIEGPAFQPLAKRTPPA